MSNQAQDYWKVRFTEGVDHHSKQNLQISQDFTKEVKQRAGKIELLFTSSKTIIEFGCGTGEMSKLIFDEFHPALMLGTDFSKEAVDFANKKFYQKDLLQYVVLDLLDNLVISKSLPIDIDLGVISNVLEHFKNPFKVIDKCLQRCKKLIILVPYNQPCTDGYDNEGGAGHVFQFTEESFKDYKVLDSFKFKTDGWQHSSKGETPLQLVIVIERK